MSFAQKILQKEQTSLFVPLWFMQHQRNQSSKAQILETIKIECAPIIEASSKRYSADEAAEKLYIMYSQLAEQ